MKRMKFLNNGAIKESLTLEKGFEKFINHKTALSKADETLKYYTHRFEKFSEYVAKTTSIKFVHELTDEVVDGYILYQRQQNANIANTTINNHLRAIRCVLYYLMEKNYMPYFKVQLTKAKNKPKDGYSLEEQEKLLKKP